MSDAEAIRTMKELTQALRQTNRMAFVTDEDRAGTPMADRLASLERQYKEHSDMLSKVNRGMLNIFPSLDIFRDTIKKTTHAFEKSIMGQTDAYKEAATATYKYAKGTGDSAKKLEGIAKSMDGIQSATDDIMKSAKGRSEIEKQLADTTATNAKKVLAASRGWDNISGVITATTQDIRNTKRRITRLQARELDAEGKARLREERKNLQSLERSRREMKDIQKSLFDNLRDALRSGEFTNAIQNIRDPQLRAIMTKLMEMGKLNNKQLMDKLSELSGIVDGVSSGGSMASKEKKDRLLSMEEDYYRKTDQFRKSLIPALGMTLKKELGLVSERQMRGARQQGLRYSAAMMGMSESSALRLQDENRFVLTQMALTSGHTSAESFFRSGDFRQIQQHGRLLGLRGEQAAETMLGFADTLRRMGITPTADNLGGMSRFIKHGHQRYGISQDDMIRRFENMASDAMIAGIISGSDDLFEAITRETDSRMKLARQLNQEVDIQEKRLRQMTDLATGDPAEALTSSIMAMMTGSVAGVDMSGDRSTILMQLMRGDPRLTPEDRKRAERLYEDIINASGKLWTEDMGSRFILSPLMRGSGIDIRESIENFARLSGVVPGSLDTPLPVERLDFTVDKIIGSLEKLEGALSSSAGSVVGVVGAFGGTLLQYAGFRMIESIFGRGMGGGLSGIFGKVGLGRIATRTGGVLRSPIARFGGPAAGIAMGTVGHVMSISQLNEQRKRGEISAIEHKSQRDREIAGMAGGIAGGIIGAIVGSFIPIPGASIGLAMVGQWAGSKLGGMLGASTERPLSSVYTYHYRQQRLLEDDKYSRLQQEEIQAEVAVKQAELDMILGDISEERLQQVRNEHRAATRRRQAREIQSALLMGPQPVITLAEMMESGPAKPKTIRWNHPTNEFSGYSISGGWTGEEIGNMVTNVQDLLRLDKNLTNVHRSLVEDVVKAMQEYDGPLDTQQAELLNYLVTTILPNMSDNLESIRVSNALIQRGEEARFNLQKHGTDLIAHLRGAYNITSGEGVMGELDGS